MIVVELAPTAVAKLMGAYTAAVRAKDVDAFCAIYAHDVRVFDAWDVWEYADLESWRKMVTDWFGSLGDENVDVTFENIRVSPGARSDFAIASAFVTYTGLSADGTPLRSLQGRLTWGVAETNHKWKVVHEHSSSPVTFETGKVNLTRPTAS